MEPLELDKGVPLERYLAQLEHNVHTICADYLRPTTGLTCVDCISSCSRRCKTPIDSLKTAANRDRLSDTYDIFLLSENLPHFNHIWHLTIANSWCSHGLGVERLTRTLCSSDEKIPGSNPGVSRSHFE